MDKVLKKLISMVVKNLDFIWAYLKYNLASAMEFRFNFLSQAIFMILNDGLFLLIWYFFFQYFGDLNGFGFREMIALWIFGAGGFGLVNAVFGNAANLGTIISNGELDFYFSFPKNHLLHALVSRTDLSAWGDMLFAPIAFFLFFPANLLSIFLLFFGILSGAMILLAFYILIGSLSFWLGRNEVLQSSLFHAFLAFSTNPSSVFQGVVKFIIFFVIPAGFATFWPADLLKEFVLSKFLYLILFTIIFFLFSLLVYYRGLKRYSSGNLINVRG
ncbi:ABC-2 family transporter protein [Candidatus Nomurabacteria bacterium]|nr:ABC-2 family transporter protein [Candidatus Nomurabacteria bacterium]